MPNRLQHETSPYLLQHKDNPVDWYPWGEEALTRSRQEDKPMLVSIGYSACHWCHVMEHESFEDPETAAVMNEHFVNIKVDREERPDVDSLYMTAVQAMTGHGGWPLNVFLMPDGTPFYGGTYWPPEDRHGMPAFRRVIEAVAETYTTQREQIEEQGERVRAVLQAAMSAQADEGEIEDRLITEAVELLESRFDREWGGFGGAPKFPQASVLDFLLRADRAHPSARAKNMITTTLDKMAAGGMYDQIGGGFHRYAVDQIWLVPHFEKMLYDNAQLARAYLDGFRAYRTPRYREVVEETLDYVLREMTSPEGGFFATQDADSEGEEGKFYVWTPEELVEVLGPERARVVGTSYGVEPGGNFEGKSILHTPFTEEETARALGIGIEELRSEVAVAKPQLLEARSRRVWPGRDDKVLASWNGMMLRAFAEASRTLDRADYREAAVKCADFILGPLSQDGRLFHAFKDGRARIPGFLEDYANVADGFVALYEATFDLRWLREAIRLSEAMVEEFGADDGVSLYDTSSRHEALVARPRDLQDGATPSGTSVAAGILLKLGRMVERPEWEQRAGAILAGMAQAMNNQPLGYGRHLSNAVAYLAPAREIAIAAERGDLTGEALARVPYERFEPHAMVALVDEASSELMPWLADRPMRGGQATAYLCERFTCLPPVTTPKDLRKLLETGVGIAWQEL